jgi:hypothetical protein
MEKIIDQRIGKRTRRKTYFEYLVKWKGHPKDDAGASTSTLKGGQVGVNTSSSACMKLIWTIQRRVHLFEFEFNEKKCN